MMQLLRSGSDAILAVGPRSGQRWRRAKVLLAFLPLLGFALTPGGSSGARAQTQPNPLTVSGEGTATLPPDVAEVSGTVMTRASTAADALDQNSQALNAVIAAVRTAGVADADITTARLQVDPVSQAGVTVSYQARNSLTIKTADLSHVGDLVQAMVNAGLTNVDRIAYALRDPEQLPVQALRAATASTQKQAQALATTLGLRLGPPSDFSADPNLREPDPLTAPAPTPSAAGTAPAPLVVPGPFAATARVKVTFSVFAP